MHRDETNIATAMITETGVTGTTVTDTANVANNPYVTTNELDSQRAGLIARDRLAMLKTKSILSNIPRLVQIYPSRDSMNQPLQIDKAQAQLLMSRLLDGELSPAQAKSLQAYLSDNPQEVDWMENVDTIREQMQTTASITHRDASINSVQRAIASTEQESEKRHNLISFPRLLRPLAAAAVIAIVGTVTWLGVRPGTAPKFEPNVIEFVATDIPNSSTYIIPDEETGWTVVWVDTDFEATVPGKG